MSARLPHLVFLFAALISFSGMLAAEQPPLVIVDYCVKVEPAKAAEFETFMKDVTVKIQQKVLEAGEIQAYTFARAVFPSGTDANCDYVFFVSSAGMPKEGSPERAASLLSKAGVNLTYEQYAAKLMSLAKLRTSTMMMGVAWSGQLVTGDYFRLNHMKLNVPSSEWVAYLNKVTAPLYAQAVKGGAQKGWGASVLYFPGGAGQPANAFTLDVYTNWDAIGVASMTAWQDAFKKAHPGLKWEDHLYHTEKIRTIVQTELYRVIAAGG